MPIALRETNGNSRPRVFALDPLQSGALALAQKHFDLVLSSNDQIENWKEEADGLLVIGSQVTKGDFDRVGSRLRFVSKQGTGVDKIDIEAAKAKGIKVLNTPGVNVGGSHVSHEES